MKKSFYTTPLSFLLLLISGCSSPFSSPDTNIPVATPETSVVSTPPVSTSTTTPLSTLPQPAINARQTVSRRPSSSTVKPRVTTPSALTFATPLPGLGVTLPLPFAPDDTLSCFSSCNFERTRRDADYELVQEGKMQPGQFTFIGQVSKHWSPVMRGFVLQAKDLPPVPTPHQTIQSTIGNITVLHKRTDYFAKVRSLFGAAPEQGEDQQVLAIFTPPQHPNLRVVLVYFVDPSLSAEEFERALGHMKVR